VDACNPLLQAHPTWARDEHEGRGISTSLTPVSGHLAFPPFALAHALDPSGLGHAAHSLVGLGTPRSRNADTCYLRAVRTCGARRRRVVRAYRSGVILVLSRIVRACHTCGSHALSHVVCVRRVCHLHMSLALLRIVRTYPACR
jgi:hypothetical protein